VKEIPRFQTGCHHFLGQHGIDIEEFPVVPEEFEEGNLRQPVVVIHHGEAVFTEEFLHLGGEAFCIVPDGFLGLEDTLRLPAGGIADGAGTAADNDDRMVAGQLEPLQDHKGNEMTDVHAVTGGIDATVEGNGFFPYQFVQSFFIGLLVHSAAPFQSCRPLEKGRGKAAGWMRRSRWTSILFTQFSICFSLLRRSRLFEADPSPALRAAAVWPIRKALLWAG
jgi:hypothetical protein